MNNTTVLTPEAVELEIKRLTNAIEHLLSSNNYMEKLLDSDPELAQYIDDNNKLVAKYRDEGTSAFGLTAKTAADLIGPKEMICQISWLLFFISTVSAIKFSVYAGVPNGPPYCVRDFVFKDALVVINGEISGKNREGQHLTVFVTDDKANEYSRKKDVKDKFQVVFTSHTDATIDICFDNVASNNHVYNSFIDVNLDVEIGASARDWNSIRIQDKLKPSEMELKRVEELTIELSNELDYLKKREAKLRDTNESTNGRVKVFSLGVIASLVSLGIWQILYLRAYFRSKHII